MRLNAWCVTVVFLAGAGGTVLLADVLTLRDGRRIEGTLIAVRGDTIEFEQRGGWGQRGLRRYSRDDVRRIEFDAGAPDVESYAGDTRDRRALRERTVVVNARERWTDTGVTIRPGQDVTCSATGTVRWGPGRQDGPGGERNSPRNDLRPMPARSAAGLIGKIGEEGDPFFIGGQADALRMRAGGRLFLGINDEYLADNSGSLRVVIAY